MMKNNKVIKIILLVAVVLIAATVVGLLVFRNNKNETVPEQKNNDEIVEKEVKSEKIVYVKINPLIKITYDEIYKICGTEICSEIESKIIKTEMLNEDAERIYVNVNLEGMNIYNGIEKLVNVAKENGINTESISLYYDSENFDKKELVLEENTIVNGSYTTILDEEILKKDTVIYTVTFNSDGGSSVASQTVENGKKANKPSDPTKNGYAFVEWQLNGKSYNFDNVVTKNITLKAKWEKIEDTVVLDEDLSNLYFTKINKHLKPKKLLVLLFNYNNGFYEMEDSEIEKEWSDYIFGTGSIHNNDASINDYFKEISFGKFYYEPVYLGDNKTGVYSVHLNKDYSDEQGNHAEYPFFEFEYDIAHALDDLINKGLDISSYSTINVNNKNYGSIMFNYFDANQSFFNSQWFDTNTILCVFPSYNKENVSFAPLSSQYNNFTLYAHLNSDSSFGTIAHELLHTLGTIDIYNFGSYGSDIMSDCYTRYIFHDYNTIHVDPYYKILFGWAKGKIAKSSGKIRLYPSTSKLYNPIIIETESSNQYYIIENRVTDGFDHGLSYSSSDGINIWHIDKLGMEARYNRNRKGMQLLGILQNKGDYLNPTYYEDFNNIKIVTEKVSSIKITYIEKHDDGSVTIQLDQ